jgi:hypothetical protein
MSQDAEKRVYHVIPRSLNLIEKTRNLSVESVPFKVFGS